MAIEMLHIDCMEYMRGLPDNAFELAIVDPPYGIGESGGNESRNRVATKNYAKKDWDKVAPNLEYFIELRRVSKNQIIWGANHFIDNLGVGCSSPCWVVWDKDNGASDFADAELAWTSLQTAVRIFKYTWAGMHQGTRGGDVRLNEKRIHPTQKPVKLYDWLLKNYAKEGDRILDTHLGSGSSAISAHYSDFDFVGCELDEDYYNAAVVRFNDETKQAGLF